MEEKTPKRLRTAKQEVTAIRKEFEAMKSILKKTVDMLNEVAKETTDKFASYEKMLAEITSTNSNAEETLLNVLLAIRQNEYLQAWYPARQGFAEMKVTGTHPAKLVQ